MIASSLFKKYDIRGRALGDDAPLTPEAGYEIGGAFATWLFRVHGKHLAVMGYDNRVTSPSLARAVSAGMRDAGCSVVDIGLVSTPLVYWHAVQHDNAGGVMVTGSHLGPDQNGFKLSVGPVNVYGDELQALLEMIEFGDVEVAHSRGPEHRDQGSIRTYSLLTGLRVHMPRSLKVVVDAGNGTAGLIAPKLFADWGLEVVPLFCEPDGHYPNHQPDPQNPANMVDLGEKVRETGADLGIGFDGDADRLGAVDEQGTYVSPDRLLALLAVDMLGRRPGSAVVADVLTSQTVFDAVSQAGGRPVLWASGHALVKEKMREEKALLGGEASGHLFLAEDYYGFDDAYLAAGRLLRLLAAGEQPLTQLVAGLPAYFSTPEYRPHCADEAKAGVIAGIRAVLEGDADVRRVIDVDGVRIQYPSGWGLLRASNTEPVLSLRFEATTEAEAHALRDRFFAALAAYPEVEPIAV
ncbi:MAG: phosphomannomutase/phosphoglucomutase [Anaerolineae bacterium]